MEEVSYKTKVHLLVCINDRTGREGNMMPSCGPTITADYVTEIKLWIQQQGWAGAVVATKCQCLGLCTPKGGVACVYPSGRFFKGVKTVDELKGIIKSEVDLL